MVGLDGAQLADQRVVLGVGDLGVVERVVALVVVGDQPAQLVGACHRIGTADRSSPPGVRPSPASVFRTHPAIPEPSTTSGSVGS